MLGKLPTNLDKQKPSDLLTKYIVEFEHNRVLIRIFLVTKSQNRIELLINKMDQFYIWIGFTRTHFVTFCQGKTETFFVWMFVDDQDVFYFLVSSKILRLGSKLQNQFVLVLLVAFICYFQQLITLNKYPTRAAIAIATNPQNVTIVTAFLTLDSPVLAAIIPKIIKKKSAKP